MLASISNYSFNVIFTSKAPYTNANIDDTEQNVHLFRAFLFVDKHITAVSSNKMHLQDPDQTVNAQDDLCLHMA